MQGLISCKSSCVQKGHTLLSFLLLLLPPRVEYQQLNSWDVQKSHTGREASWALFFQFLSRLKALWGTEKSREVARIQTIIFSPFSRSSMHSCVGKKTWQNRTLLHFLLVPMWNKHTSHLLKREVSPVCKGITLPNPSRSAAQTRIHSCYHTAILLNDGLFPTGAAALGLMQQI